MLDAKISLIRTVLLSFLVFNVSFKGSYLVLFILVFSVFADSLLFMENPHEAASIKGFGFLLTLLADLFTLMSVKLMNSVLISARG